MDMPLIVVSILVIALFGAGVAWLAVRGTNRNRETSARTRRHPPRR